MLDQLNSKRMTDAGTMDALDEAANSDSDDENHRKASEVLPGVSRGDLSKRKTGLEVRTKCVRFSPTGTQWAAASTEGLLIYSLDEQMTFSPYELSEDITSATVKDALREQLFSKALVMSLHLNEPSTIAGVLQRVPSLSIPLVARSLPTVYVKRTLDTLAEVFTASPHLQYNLQWLLAVLNAHGAFLAANSAKNMSAFRRLHDTMTRQYKDMVGL